MKVLLEFMANNDAAKGALFVAKQAHYRSSGNRNGRMQSLPLKGRTWFTAAILALQEVGQGDQAGSGAGRSFVLGVERLI